MTSLVQRRMLFHSTHKEYGRPTALSCSSWRWIRVELEELLGLGWPMGIKTISNGKTSTDILLSAFSISRSVWRWGFLMKIRWKIWVAIFGFLQPLFAKEEGSGKGKVLWRSFSEAERGTRSKIYTSSPLFSLRFRGRRGGVLRLFQLRARVILGWLVGRIKEGRRGPSLNFKSLFIGCDIGRVRPKKKEGSTRALKLAG